MDVAMDLYLAIRLLFIVLALILTSVFVMLWGAEGEQPREPPAEPRKPKSQEDAGDHAALPSKAEEEDLDSEKEKLMVDLDSMMPLPLDLVLKVFLDASGESSQGKGRTGKRVPKAKGDKKSKTGKETSRDKASNNDVQLRKGRKILKLRPCSSNINLKSMMSHTRSRTFFL
ncbi:hypothetical protein AAES_61630 [Amazona aestiva]|uniref:Uncharacterized protein n=1 Tax=Amazona aestiva TaxID=12930 RepID=A0A0Q3UT48_AMAAE|nr:hypothetical protein AAES_61630 [Amazona aestiva]